MSVNPASPETKVRKPIPEAEWIVSLTLGTKGKQLHFADSFVAKNPGEFGRLLAAAAYELATK